MSLERPERALLRVPLGKLRAGELQLPPDAARYVARVHRLIPGDRFVAFDPVEELEAEAELLPSASGRPAQPGARRARRARSARSKAIVWVRLGEPRASTARPARHVTLVQAVGKGAKVDAIVRDATELGVSRIVPVVAERSIRRPASTSGPVARWRRVVVEAARQCGRGDVPTVDTVIALADALSRCSPRSAGSLGLCLVPAGSEPLRTALGQLEPEQPVVVVVGPEGGLSAAEVQQAQAEAFRLVHLGPFVLRTETVCAAVLGAILAHE